MNIIKRKKNIVFLFTLIIVSIIVAVLTRLSISKELDFLSVIKKLENYPFYTNYPENINLETLEQLEDHCDVIAIVTPTIERKILSDSIITRVQVNNIIKGNITDSINVIEPISIYYETNKKNNQSSISSTFGYNFMKSDKQYILLLNKIDTNQSEELYTYHNIYSGKFPLIYNELDYKVDNINMYTNKDIYQYEQIFNNDINFSNYYELYINIISKYNVSIIK